MAGHTIDGTEASDEDAGLETIELDESHDFVGVPEKTFIEGLMDNIFGGSENEEAQESADITAVGDNRFVASGSPDDDYVAMAIGDGNSAKIATGAGNDTIQIYSGDNTVIPGPDDDEITLNGGNNRIVLQAGDGSEDTVIGYASFADELDTSLFVGFEPNLNATLDNEKSHLIGVSTEFSNSEGNLEIHFNNKVTGGTSQITFDGVTQANFGGLDIMPKDDAAYGTGNEINVLLKP